jgi:hypothetical protein
MSSSAFNNDIAVAACFSSFLAAIGDADLLLSILFKDRV